MNAKANVKKRRNRIIYFFPVQLLLLHLKKNHLLLFTWIFFFAIITGNFGKNMGVPQQFLVPEYRGATGLISFAILGFSIGGFISGFNLYTYIMHGYRFEFIATLSKPFHKFCINNFLLPAVFLLTYIYCSARFQIEKELIPPWKVVLNLLSFFAALTAFQTISYLYFNYTNKEAASYATSRKRIRHVREDAPVDSPIHHPIKWFRERLIRRKWYVETYLSSLHRISLARDSHHYKKEILEQVFAQNHINASRYELALLISFLVLGSLRATEFFIIPAGASAMLFFTMLIMAISALHSWLRGWTFILFVLFLLLLNTFYSELRFIRQHTKAYGLNYESAQPVYDPALLIPDQDRIDRDKANTLAILENWKARVTVPGDSLKPRLVILNHSGGGSRSAYWTMRSLAYADSICGGKLLSHTVMITGASGGMVGAAYMRELMLRKAWGEPIDLYSTEYTERIGRDLLNPILLSAATNDWFIRYQHFNDGANVYAKDRATAFEEQLARNTKDAFNRRLRDYTEPEREAIIPMMILSPTILNDGRRLLIASQPISYLTMAHHFNGMPEDLPEDIEYADLFKNNDAMNLHFASALRMNATFPYVTPSTTLPTVPQMDVLDAGIRDNFGLKTTMQFLQTFHEWINENTSGVVIVQIRDLPKNRDLSDHSVSLFGKFSGPIGGIYGNITKTHDYTSEQSLRYLQKWFDDRIQLVTFELEQSRSNHITLSWHLTKSERVQIMRSVQDSAYRKELTRLRSLLSSY